MFWFFKMNTINFAGIQGTVIESSPHNNYLVVTLSDRIAICGTKTNIWNWEEAEDISSGFISFITYIGVRSQSEAIQWVTKAASNGGYFHKNEDTPRKSKRTKLPYEIKVRGLSTDFVVQLINPY